MTLARFFWHWAPAALLALVVGCAAPPQGAYTAGSGQDLTTDSDESEARKRARLRVELASGYFEQGQTTVALDEIKQALNADPAYAPAFNLRGLAYLRLSEFRLAEDSFRTALRINPRDAGVAHNLGWMLCQQSKFAEAMGLFGQALANPIYPGQAKTLMAQGICQARAGQVLEAESSLSRSFELDAANPVTAFNLAKLLAQRGDLPKAQFHLRRLNNSDLANAETLWQGIKVERRLGNAVAERQLGDQLKRRYPQSKELGWYERGAFDE